VFPFIYRCFKNDNKKGVMNMKPNTNTNDMGGIGALIAKILLSIWTAFFSGLKTCGSMIFSVFKAARRSITLYLSGSDADRSNLRASLISTLKTTAIALAIVLAAGVCINTLFSALIRATFTFVPVFLMDAIGYLFLGTLLRVVVQIAEKLSVRSDVSVKARKMIEFGMSALVPVAIWNFVNNATTAGIYMLFSSVIASWGYRIINEIRARMANNATA